MERNEKILQIVCGICGFVVIGIVLVAGVDNATGFRIAKDVNESAVNLHYLSLEGFGAFAVLFYRRLMEIFRS